jgi:inner membrane protein
MASIFGHAETGFTISKAIDTRNLKWLIIASIFSTILPDLDVVAFNFGIAYEHHLGHRGFTHSILFALLWALVLMFDFGKKHKLTWFLIIFLTT